MFHNKPLLLIVFFLGTPLIVLLFGKMGWGTNNIFPAIVVTAVILGGGSWVLKRVGRSVPNKATGFHFLMTGQTDPTRGALVRYEPQHLQRYGYADRVQVTEEGSDEYDEDEYDEDGEERYVEEEQFTVQQGFRHSGPNGMREQIGVHSVGEQRNVAHLMKLAQDLIFHADRMLSGRVSVFGLPNSGKSNLIAVLCENLGRLKVPFVLADTEDEYSPLVDHRHTWLPNGYTAGNPNAFAEGTEKPPHFVGVDQAGAYYFGQMVLEHGFQVVLNLESYDSDEEAALVMCDIVRGMRDWEQQQPAKDRVSCMFILEEAASWLPQNTRETKDRLSAETLALLQSTMFNMVVRKGRKRGIGFIFATQRAAEIDKRAMQSSWRFLLWQTEKNDLDVYEEMCPQIDRDRVAKFSPGETVVQGPGVVLHTRICKRQSPHGAPTPGLASVQRRYGNTGGGRFHTQDLTQHLLANAANSSKATRALNHGTTAQRPTELEPGASAGEGDRRVVQFPVHPSQVPQPNTEQQLAWGCAVFHYLHEQHLPFTLTAVRRPRQELRDVALALGVLKQGADEIIGGGSRAERIKSDVEQIPGPRMLELLRLVTQAQASYQATSPVLASQAAN